VEGGERGKHSEQWRKWQDKENGMMIFFFFFWQHGVCTQGLILARQAALHLSHTTNPFFVLGIFHMES
jgi:hypothetical protein